MLTRTNFSLYPGAWQNQFASSVSDAMILEVKISLKMGVLVSA